MSAGLEGHAGVFDAAHVRRARQHARATANRLVNRLVLTLVALGSAAVLLGLAIGLHLPLTALAEVALLGALFGIDRAGNRHVER